MCKIFNIYIYTMGNRIYGKNILKILWSESSEITIPESNLITRDDGHEHTHGNIMKTLRQLSPSEPTFQIILDDRDDVWPECKDNLVLCYPYQYFNHRPEDNILKKGHPKMF